MKLYFSFICKTPTIVIKLKIMMGDHKDNIRGISLSANWMWPCKNKGEDARLFKAVEAVSEFAIDLGINIPTGKDSLSMNQKYKDQEVKSPGTVIISATGHCENINFVVETLVQCYFSRSYK